MTWGYFAVMVLLTLPGAIAYPLVYAIYTRWWRDWLGWSLLVNASGLTILLGFTAAVLVFGPDYPGRYLVRGVGITCVFVGVYSAIWVMVREFRRTPSSRRRR